MKDVVRDDRFSIAVSVEIAERGEAVIARVVFENRGERRVEVRLWVVLDEVGFTRASFEVEREGERVPYRGRMVKRAVTERDWRAVGAGEKRVAERVLGEGYDVSARGRYRVRFRDYAEVRGGEACELVSEWVEFERK